MQITKPTKESVRQWLKEKKNMPPQTPEEIRRKLGWNMIKTNSKGQAYE